MSHGGPISPRDGDEQPAMQPLGSISDGWSHFSLRAVAVGLLIGTLVSLSNTYYGLQTGVGYQMYMASGLLGYFAFKILPTTTPLTTYENVLITSAATATGCIPLTASLQSIIPALEYIVGDGNGGKVQFSFGQLLLWSVGLSGFGIAFAALMRKRLVEEERLPWPGAKAMSQMLLTVHSKTTMPDRSQRHHHQASSDLEISHTASASSTGKEDVEWQSKMFLIARSGIAASLIVRWYLII